MRGQYKKDGDTVLTGVEVVVEREQEIQNCTNCHFLQYQKRSGARVCIQAQDMCPVLCGDILCDFWEVI